MVRWLNDRAAILPGIEKKKAEEGLTLPPLLPIFYPGIKKTTGVPRMQAPVFQQNRKKPCAYLSCFCAGTDAGCPKMNKVVANPEVVELNSW
jgi:hypothetical protein